MITIFIFHRDPEVRYFTGSQIISMFYTRTRNKCTLYA